MIPFPLRVAPFSYYRDRQQLCGNMPPSWPNRHPHHPAATYFCPLLNNNNNINISGGGGSDREKAACRCRPLREDKEKKVRVAEEVGTGVTT